MRKFLLISLSPFRPTLLLAPEVTDMRVDTLKDDMRRDTGEWVNDFIIVKTVIKDSSFLPFVKEVHFQSKNYFPICLGETN